MTDHLPQPYPLWCAEVYPDGAVTVGRVVAWDPSGAFGTYPLVAFTHPNGNLSAVTVPDADRPLYLAETRDQAEALAVRASGAAEEPNPLDHAMWTVWLESGKWRWATQKMTTEAREAAVAAVLRHDKTMEKDPAEWLDRSSLAWWD